MSHLYSVGDRIEASIPGGVVVSGPIVSQGETAVGLPCYTVESTYPTDDGHRYNVLEGEITVVLDS